ncbi:MAG TPA: ABC transporter permease [Candidatus Micrarchaeia archaeon]|nr:ABC transporter permease [Candidatus Micrarchaeia archaeon]
MTRLVWRKGSLGRLVLALLALAVASAAVLATQLTTTALQRQAAAALAARAGRADADVTAFATQGFSPTATLAISRTAGVIAAQPLRQKAVLAQLPGGGFRQVVLVATSGTGQVALRRLPMVSGRAPRPAALFQVAVSVGLSGGVAAPNGTHLPGRIRLGGSLELTQLLGLDRFHVSGLVADSGPGAPFAADAVYVSAAAADRLFADGLRTAAVAVRLRPGTTLGDLVRRLARTVGEPFVVSDPRVVPGGDPAGELRPVLLVITLESLVLAAGLLLAVLSAVVAERRQEIGLLRLAGASRWRIFVSLLGEALVLCGAGTAVGIGAGTGLAMVLLAHFAPGGGSPSPRLVVPAAAVGLTALLGIGLGGAAAAVTALRANGVAPMAALQPAPVWPARRAALLPLAFAAALAAALAFAAGGPAGVAVGVVALDGALVACLPTLGPAVVGLVGRVLAPLLGVAPAAVRARSRERPGRVALGTGTLVVSLATAVSLAGLSAGALRAGSTWVDQLFVGNQLVVSPVPQPESVETAVTNPLATAGPGGRRPLVASVRFLPARIGHRGVDLAVTEPAVYLRARALAFVAGSRAPALRATATGRGVIAPLSLALAAGWRLGTRLHLATATGAASFTVVGIVRHTLPGPSGAESLVVGRGPAATVFGAPASGFTLLQLAVRRGPVPVRRLRLLAFRYGMETVSVAAVRRGVDAGLAHVLALLQALALAGVVVALLAATDTLLVRAREGTGELGLLRTVGLSAGEVRRLVVTEALAIGLVGGVIGVGLGLLQTWPVLVGATTSDFGPTFVVPVPTLLAIVGVVVAAVGLVALLPARQASGRPLLDALRTE